MKIRLTIIFLMISAFALSPVFAQKAAAVSIQGQLLKTNGKPLPYTELELVPVDSDKIVIDGRLIAASGASGKFTFVNVPDGKYTLSINFGDIPSNLSPYPEYFYPGTYKRGEAQILEVTRTSKFTPVTFRLPSPLVERKFTGKVVFADGTPVRGAFIALKDVAFDRSNYIGTVNTDNSGNFWAKGFDGREYQIGALLFENDKSPRPDLAPYNEVLAAGESKIFTLNAQTPVIQLEMKTKGNLDGIKEKYIGMTIFKNREALWNTELFSFRSF